MNYIIGLMIVILVIETKSLELPSNFKICPRSLPDFSECISNAASEAIISMAQGLPSFGIPELEPFDMGDVSAGETSGPVSVKQNYRNAKLHGLTKGLKIKYDSNDTDSLVLRFNCSNEQVDFIADYRMSGNVLLLPVSGRGSSNVTMVGLESKNAMHCERYEKDGESHLRVTKYEIEFTPTNVLFNFTNLYSSDPEISGRMNRFLNENSELVFRETKGNFEEKFGSAFAKVANEFFSRVPEKKIFPE